MSELVGASLVAILTGRHVDVVAVVVQHAVGGVFRQEVLNGVANVRGTASTTGFGKNLISNKAKNTTAIRNLSGYYLKEVRIVCVNSSGTEVYNKVRSPHYSDFPADPSGFKETIDEVTLSAYIPNEAWSTITNSGCRLTATLIYDIL